MIPHSPNEIIAIVNEKDEVIAQSKRRYAHVKGLLHREICIYVINSKKQVLLHKRTDNNLWDHSCSGHVNEDYEESAVREFEEELGIKISKNKLQEIAKEKLTLTSYKVPNNRFLKIFLIKKDMPIGEFNINKEEVKEIKYYDIDELRKLISTPGKTTSSSKYIIEKYILEEVEG